MKKYIKSDVDLEPGKYVGGKLSDFGEDMPIERASDIYKYIYDFSDNYIVCYTYKSSGNGKYELWRHVGFNDVCSVLDELPIKDGVDLIDRQTYLEIVAYNGNKQSVVYLYPISERKTNEILSLVDSIEIHDYISDFDDIITKIVVEESKSLNDVDDMSFRDIVHYILQGWG